MKIKENIKITGCYTFENLETGEIKEFKNVVCQNFFTKVFKLLKNLEETLDVLNFATGTGQTPALKSNTALEAEYFRKPLSSVNYTNTRLICKTVLSTTESNINIKEVGIFFSDGSILSRCNVNIEKNVNIQYLVTYTLIIE